ncbi:hypothetical protein [Oligella urethralis]|uniref:hypothetical protein n=1 Tax=Oligella urethralis TaxID=90245 RepID=UPI00066030E0|nr:hypothetical protein [Oligella urethralis]
MFINLFPDSERAKQDPFYDLNSTEEEREMYLEASKRVRVYERVAVLLIIAFLLALWFLADLI